jgi:K+-transporting ATPase ATPase B chain
MAAVTHPLFDGTGLIAVKDAFRKLTPRHMLRNPVMFVVLVGSVLTTISLVHDIVSGGESIGFTLQISIWLWFTVLFANFAEAMAEGRGKAQAESLRRTRQEAMAKLMTDPDNHLDVRLVSAAKLRVGDYVFCAAGNVIPGDGEVVEGVASVDESAITGESAPVVRESGGDRSPRSRAARRSLWIGW